MVLRRNAWMVVFAALGCASDPAEPQGPESVGAGGSGSAFATLSSAGGAAQTATVSDGTGAGGMPNATFGATGMGASFGTAFGAGGASSVGGVGGSGQPTAAGGATSAGGVSASGGGASSTGQGAGGTAGTGSSGQGGGGAGGDNGSCETPFDTLDVSELATSETLTSYVVVGGTAEEIRSNINQVRNADYDAYTSWDIAWSFADCSGNGLLVSVDVTYRVPEWQPPDSPDPVLVESWETYMTALFCHEYGHAQFGLEAGLETYAALSGLETNGDCDQQQTLATQAFSAILNDYIARELQYDSDTNHGATHGAVFPP